MDMVLNYWQHENYWIEIYFRKRW